MKSHPSKNEGWTHPTLTDDADLLTLNSWRSIAILSPAEYLKR